jgi:alkaline phosphatase
MKRFYFGAILFCIVLTLTAQQQYKRPVKPVKNVIVMIPDGTSTSVLSIARWFQIYNKLGGDQLNLDPYLCGMVKTYLSDAPVPDSAPAMSAYMTGIPSRRSRISVYPDSNPGQNIYPVDSTMAYQPLMTVFEAAKVEKKKSTGLVVTVAFSHATPAACTSHHYNRSKYEYLAPQIAYNGVDVVFGGGAAYVTEDMKEHLRKNNTDYIVKDMDAFRQYTGDKNMWALFDDSDLPYELDMDQNAVPPLCEMTEKALSRLSKDPNGFFLMVEGSKVDWAAHGMDPIAIISEFLAFDKAVGVALDFAKKDGETAVVILPDHGTSGLSFGSPQMSRYSERGLDYIFNSVSKYKRTAGGLEKILLNTKPEEIKSVFKEYTGIELTDDELNLLLSSKNYKAVDYTEVGNSVNMGSSIAKIMTAHTYFQFISGNHTGEDVFLSVYHPDGDVPYGLNTNTDINNYLCDIAGLQTSLADHTKQMFAKHTDVFAEYDCSIDTSGKETILTVKKGKKTLTIPAFKSVAYLNDKPFDIGMATVYIDRNNVFYLPKNLVEKLK